MSELKQIHQIISRMEPYWEECWRDSPQGAYLYDAELKRAASACTTAEVGSALLFQALYTGDETRRLRASQAMAAARRLQNPDGSLGQPFYLLPDQEEVRDIAEIGACADSGYWLARQGVIAGEELLVGSARYLLAQTQHPQNPGIFYKRPDSTDHDVLNGDAYAGGTLARAYQITGDEAFLQGAMAVAAHLTDRYGRHEPHWWPYSEKPDGSIFMGNSISYQATVIAFGTPILAVITDESLQEEYSQALKGGMALILEHLNNKQAMDSSNEVAWWARNWQQSWEMILALWRQRELPGARELWRQQVSEIDQKFHDQGIGYFTPPVSPQADPLRSPVSTTFRRAATLAGVLSFVGLESFLEKEG